MNDIEKIRMMAQYLDDEAISRLFKIPVDVVRDIASGKIDSIEVKKNTPQSQRTIHVLERQRIVRNKTITAISPGGGYGKSTILSSLALAASMYSPVVLVDFAGFSKTAAFLGYNQTLLAYSDNEEGLPVSINDYAGSKLIDEDMLVTPLDNLYLIPGAITLENKINISDGVELLKQIQSKFEIVIYNNDRISEECLTLTNFIFIVLTPDYQAITGLLQMLPTLNKLDVLNRCSVIINRSNRPNSLNINDFKRLIKSVLSEVEIAAILPEENDIIKFLNNNRGEHVVINRPDSVFVQEIKSVLNYLCPDMKVYSEAPEGKAGLSRLFHGLINGQ